MSRSRAPAGSPRDGNPVGAGGLRPAGDGDPAGGVRRRSHRCRTGDGAYRAPQTGEPDAALAAAADGSMAMPTAGATLTRSPVPYRTDEMSLTLKPGEGGEIKAVMARGSTSSTRGRRTAAPWMSTCTARRSTRRSGRGDQLLEGRGAGRRPGRVHRASGRAARVVLAELQYDQVVTVTVRTSGFYSGWCGREGGAVHRCRRPFSD